MQRKRTWWKLVVGVVLLAAAGWWGWTRDGEVRREDPTLLFDRLWVDSAPRKATDYIQALVVLSKLPVGVFQKASSYRLLAERFDFRRKGGALEIRFPQSGRDVRVGFRVRGCDDLPPYDLCLELDKNPWEGGPRRYYGARDQRQATAEHQRLRRRLLQLAE